MKRSNPKSAFEVFALNLLAEHENRQFKGISADPDVLIELFHKGRNIYRILNDGSVDADRCEYESDIMLDVFDSKENFVDGVPTGDMYVWI